VKRHRFEFRAVFADDFTRFRGALPTGKGECIMDPDTGYITVTFNLNPMDVPNLGQCVNAVIDLSGFTIGSAQEGINHDTFLNNYTTVFTGAAGCMFDLVGMASFTGSASFNQALSQQRANTIQTQLINRGIDKSQIRVDVGVGSQDMTGQGQNVNPEAGADRCVMMTFWCPIAYLDSMTSFQTAWNSDPLQQQAAPPGGFPGPGGS
jgi:hypothetical protein